MWPARLHGRAALKPQAEDRNLEGLLALIVMALDIWAIINVIQSSASTTQKVFWVIGIIVLPVIGFLAWLLLGPRRPAKT